jgi:hypothetical protein
VVPARDRGNELSKLRVSFSEGEDTMQTDLSSPIETLPYLDAFPYLATRLVPAGYHYNLLPEDLPVEDLLDIARRQARANRLPLALVLAPDEAWHLDDAVGPPRRGPVIPHGGCVLRGKLWLVDAASMRVAPGRLARLEADVKRQNKGGFLMGDLTKGGHLASPAERRRLAGVNAHGVPVGLVPCAACGEWHGEALDPSPRLRGLVVPVHCRCENHNRCARCGRPLADRRLNGNHYDETDGNIWHMPGFTALSHECGP